MDDAHTPLLDSTTDRDVQYPSILKHKPPPRHSRLNNPCVAIPDKKDVAVEVGLRLKVYSRRWYILIAYACMVGLQSLVYNTFQPISKTAMFAFEWTRTDITVIANWGPIMFFFFMPLYSWLLDTKGLRVSCLLGLVSITLGCAIRCITSDPPWVRWTMHLGQLCNGLASPVSTAAPPVLSSLWFPPHERTTATALAAMSKFVALAGSFIVAPLAVPEITQRNCTAKNLTRYELDTIQYEDYGGRNITETCIEGAEIPEPPVTQLRADIMHLMYSEAGVGVLLTLMVLLYFPRRPPLPPSASAAIRRVGFLQGLRDLRNHPSFWLLSCLYMISGGSSAAWVGTLSLNLKPTGVTQKQAGWIGFYSFVAMCVSVLLTARLGDRFPRHMKWFISGLSLITACCFLPVAMACTKVITLSLPMLYGLVIIGVVAGGSNIPLFFELGCELTYPIGEGTANGVLNLFYHIGALMCLFAYMIPQLGHVWLNWAVVVTFAVTSPAVLLLKERHLRLEVDKSVQEDTYDVIDPSLS